MTARNAFDADDPATYTGVGKLLQRGGPPPVDELDALAEAVVELALVDALVEPPVPIGSNGREPSGLSIVTREASNVSHVAAVQAFKNCSRVVGVPQKQPGGPFGQPVPELDPVCVV